MPASSSPDQPSGARERSLDEVKAEVLRRAGRFSPFESIRPQDAAAVMNSLTSLDRDHWAEAWCRVGLAYEAEGDARAQAGASAHELAELFELGFDTCRVGRYPAPTSPGTMPSSACLTVQLRRSDPSIFSSIMPALRSREISTT